MNADILMLFSQMPCLLSLYETLEACILDQHPDATVHAKTTQVSFYNTHSFACASPPFRRIKNSVGDYLLVTFGLSYQLEHPRIAVSVEAYPNRWTHHVMVGNKADINEQLMGWIAESYQFSLSKRCKSRPPATV